MFHLDLQGGYSLDTADALLAAGNEADEDTGNREQ